MDIENLGNYRIGMFGLTESRYIVLGGRINSWRLQILSDSMRVKECELTWNQVVKLSDFLSEVVKTEQDNRSSENRTD